MVDNLEVREPPLRVIKQAEAEVEAPNPSVCVFWQAAMSFYTQAMGFHPAYGFSHVRNGGEAKAAGVEADAALRVLHVPGIGLSIELLQLSDEHEHSTGKSKAHGAAAAAHLWEAGAGIGHLSLKARVLDRRETALA